MNKSVNFNDGYMRVNEDFLPPRFFFARVKETTYNIYVQIQRNFLESQRGKRVVLYYSVLNHLYERARAC